MPISIYKREGGEELCLLCTSIWDLPTRIDALEKWVSANGMLMPIGNYVADIGFTVRTDASGGGGVLHAETLEIMGPNKMNAE